MRPLPDGFDGASWDEVDPVVRGTLQDADAAWPCFLFGRVGSGKSFAAACLYGSWPSGREPLWVDVSRFLSAAMAARQGEPVGSTRKAWGVCWKLHDERDAASLWVTEAHVLSRARASGLVVLDDVGVRNPTDARRELLLSLVNSSERLLCTSNLTPAEIEKAFDDRTESRMTGGRVVLCDGPDRRKARQVFIRSGNE